MALSPTKRSAESVSDLISVNPDSASDDIARPAELERSIQTIERQIALLTRAVKGAVVAGIATAIAAVFAFTNSAEDLGRLGSFLAGTVGIAWSLAALLLIYFAFLGQRRQILNQEEDIRLN